jgi:hypothetical protein
LGPVTILFGLLMIVLGVGGYFLTGRQSWTALIPAIVGAVFVVLGAAARNDRYRKHVMHAAAALSLLLCLGMIPGGVVPLFRWMAGTPPQRPPAVISRAILAGLLLVFLVLCVRSFVRARRTRLASTDVAG